MYYKICEIEKCKDFNLGIIKKYARCEHCKKPVADVKKEECPVIDIKKQKNKITYDMGTGGKI